MSCQIKVANAPNGKPSNVYSQISKVFNADVGYRAYVHMYTKTFKDDFGDWEKGEGELDENGEPSWIEVLSNLDKHRSVNTILELTYDLANKDGTPIIRSKRETNEIFGKLEEYFIDNGIPAMPIMNSNKDGYFITINSVIANPKHLNPLEDMSRMINKLNKEIERENKAQHVSTKSNIKRELREMNRSNRGEDMDMSDANSEARNMKKAMKSLDKIKEKLPMKGHKYARILEQLDIRKRNYFKEISNLSRELDNAKAVNNISEVNKLTNIIARNRVLVSAIQGDINRILKSRVVSDVKFLAEKDIIDIITNLKQKRGFSITELQNMQQILNFWIIAGKFDKLDHIIFDKSEIASDKLKTAFREYGNMAQDLLPQVEAQLKEHFEKLIKDEYGKEVDYKNLTKLGQDIGAFKGAVVHIGEADNAILQSIYKSVRGANIRATLEAKEKIKQIDGFMVEVLKVLDPNDPFEFFKQKDAKKRNTGDLLTFNSAEYTRAKQDNYDDIVFSESSTSEQKEAAYKWKKENEILFDVRKLYWDTEDSKFTRGSKEKPFTEEDKQEHIKELKRHLGDKMFERMYAELDKKMKEYMVDKEAALDLISMDANLNDKEQITAGIIWEKNYSPFIAAKSFIDNVDIRHRDSGTVLGKRGLSYTISVPRKYKAEVTTTGKGKKKKEKLVESKELTGWHDAEFQKVLANDKLFEFWTFFVDTMQELNQYVPSDSRKRLAENSVMFAEKSITELNFDRRKGKIKSQKVLAQAFNEVGFGKELSRTTNYGTSMPNNTDPATGKRIRYVQASFIRDNKEQLDEIVERKSIIKQGQLGRPLTDDDIKEIKYNTLNELAEEKSFDLSKVLRTFALNAISYKHKAAIEDKIHLAKSIFDEIQEGETNAQDQQMTTQYGRNATKDNKRAMENYSKMLDHFMDNFDNFKTKEEEYVSKKDIYTTEEKAQIKEIDAAIEQTKVFKDKGDITEEDYTAIKEALEKQKNLIGGKLAGSKVADQALTWVQLKTMGWNLPAAIINLIYGQFANMIESVSGRFISEKSFHKATVLVRKSMTYGKNTDDAKKIEWMADNWNLLQSNLDAAQDSNKRSFLGRKFAFLSPYGFGNFAEKMNQMPIAIGIMYDTPITANDGTISNMFDAFDSTGKLKPEFRNEENIRQFENNMIATGEDTTKVKVIRKIQEVIIITHGNYNIDAPVLYKRKIFTRALGQFMSWFPAAYYARFGAEMNDSTNGIMRKGRYRSMAGYIRNKEGETLGYIEGLVVKLEAFVQVLPFSKYTMKAELNDVDRQNIMSTAREIQIILALSLIGLLLKGAKGDIPEEDEKTKALLIFTINNTKKLIDDMSFFMNPTNVQDIMKNPMPSLGIIGDLKDNINAIIRTTYGDTKISSGINEGNYRMTKEFMESVPLLKEIYKWSMLTGKEITSPGDLRDTFGTWLDVNVLGEKDLKN